MKKLEMYELRAVEAGWLTGSDFNIFEKYISLTFGDYTLKFNFEKDPFKPTVSFGRSTDGEPYVLGTLTSWLKAWKELWFSIAKPF